MPRFISFLSCLLLFKGCWKLNPGPAICDVLPTNSAQLFGFCFCCFYIPSENFSDVLACFSITPKHLLCLFVCFLKIMNRFPQAPPPQKYRSPHFFSFFFQFPNQNALPVQPCRYSPPPTPTHTLGSILFRSFVIIL